MTFPERTRLSPLLLLPVMVSTFIGYGLFHVSSNAATVMGSNGYLAVPLAACGMVPIILISFALQGRFPGQTILEYAPRIIGRIPAVICNGLLLIYAFIYMVLAMRDATSLVSTYLLDRTPYWVIMALGFGGIVYLTYHGLESVARFASFIFIPATIVLESLLLLGFVNADFRYAMPLLSLHPLDYLKGISRMSYIYFPILYLWILLGFVKRPDMKAARRSTLWALALIALVFFSKTLGAIAAFGPRGVTRYTWATMEYVHIINMPYMILEQAGVVLLIAWIAKIYTAFSIGFWSVAYSASRVFRKPDYKPAILVLAPLAFALTLIPQNIIPVLFLEDLMQKAGLFVILPYPVLLWLIAVVFRKESAAA